MSSAGTQNRSLWPKPWTLALRDRLVFLRLLTLVLAFVALWGVGAAFGVHPRLPRETTAVIVAVICLSVAWIIGIRRGRYARWWLPIEMALLVAYMYGVQDDFGPYATMYCALQHRSLFGSRKQAVVVAVSYGLVLVGGHALLPGGLRGLTPAIIAVELAIGGFAGYMMHTFADVLRRDRAHRVALEESERRFRSVIENMRETLIITDLDNRVVLANQRVRDLLGYAPEELVGRPVTDLVVGGDVRHAFKQRLEGRKKGLGELYEAEFVHKGGHIIPVEISAAPFRDGSGTIRGSQGAITDITERRHFEERLRQTSRMEAIGQLAGGIAHDFNNLLTVIKMHTELLLTDLERLDPNRASVVEIERSADRAATLTKQLLAFSRRQLLQPRDIQLATVVERCASVLRGILDDGVELRTRHDESSVAVFADPAQVEQILIALVRNANDAVMGMSERRIDVQTALVDTGRSDPRASATHQVPPGEYMTLTVTDTGTGMTADVASHLFEPFVTTKAPGQGSGLGLASVYGAVRQSGGYISVDTAPGAGTTFWIYFPVPVDAASTRGGASGSARSTREEASAALH